LLRLRLLLLLLLLLLRLLAKLRPIVEAAATAKTTAAATPSVRRDASADCCLLSFTAQLPMPTKDLPFDETPAPISISGSSSTMPLSSGLPPVPPCSAVRAHLRSASVSREMGMTLIPVL
jgi:hypothetical protein